jgi:hypothetical protein
MAAAASFSRSRYWAFSTVTADKLNRAALELPGRLVFLAHRVAAVLADAEAIA